MLRLRPYGRHKVTGSKGTTRNNRARESWHNDNCPVCKGKAIVKKRERRIAKDEIEQSIIHYLYP